MSLLKITSFGGPDILYRISLWTPTVTQLRYRRRPNLKEPTKFYEKQRVLEICKPIYAKPPKICGNDLPDFFRKQSSIDDNRYALFLARSLREKFFKYPMIAIFHLNSMTGHELLHIRGMLYDNNFEMKLHYERENYQVSKQALTGTKFEPVLPLFVSRTSLGYCTKPDVPKLLQVLKKMPQYTLIGLVLENRLLHRADVEAIAKLSDITSVRATLCHTLSLASVQLSQTITANQTALSTSLASLSQLSTSDESNKESSNISKV